MTIRDLCNIGFSIEGRCQVNLYNEDLDFATKWYSEEAEGSLCCEGCEYLLDLEIKYMFPSTDIDDYGMDVPVIVIEVVENNSDEACKNALHM